MKPPHITVDDIDSDCVRRVFPDLPEGAKERQAFARHSPGFPPRFTSGVAGSAQSSLLLSDRSEVAVNPRCRPGACRHSPVPLQIERRCEWCGSSPVMTIVGCSLR
jgi:hypothetical protein